MQILAVVVRVHNNIFHAVLHMLSGFMLCGGVVRGKVQAIYSCIPVPRVLTLIHVCMSEILHLSLLASPAQSALTRKGL